jgi:hypothetical protein
MYKAGDFMTWNDWRWNVMVFSEIPVYELHIGAAHPARLDVDKNFVGLNVRTRNVLENERFVVFPDACRFHIYFFRGG